MSVSVRGIKQTRSITNQTSIFGSLSGLPPRVGVRVYILDMPGYGLHCNSNSANNSCCCLPISQTWHLKPAQALAYLNSKGLNPKRNETCSGNVGNRVLNRIC